MSGPKEILYQDDQLTIVSDELCIAGYYFPFGNPRRVKLTDIRKVEMRTIGALSGKYLIWGCSLFGRFYPRDCSRPRKRWCIDISVKGSWLKCSITPQNVRKVYDLLCEKVPVAVDNSNSKLERMEKDRLAKLRKHSRLVS